MQTQFDEQHYLNHWWDVARAVEQGAFLSGFAHWQAFGRKEGRVHRFVGDKRDRGTVQPHGQQFLQDVSQVLDLSFVEYRHRGFGVRCCMEQKTRDRIREVTSHIRGGRIAEVGVFGGATLLELAERAQRDGNELLGIDPWERSAQVESVADGQRRKEMVHFFRQMRWTLETIIKELDYSHIRLMQDSAEAAANSIPDASLDFCLVDGDHSEEAVTRDLQAFWPKMRRGGALWGDDYDWPGVRAATDRFARERRVPLEIWNVQFIIRKP